MSKFFRSRGCGFLFGVASFLVWAAHAYATQVSEINIHGVREFEEERILQLLALGENEEFSRRSLDMGLKRLSDTGRFQSVEGVFDPNSKTLSIHLRQYDRFADIQVVFSESTQESADLHELLRSDVLELIAISKGDRISLDQLPEIRRRIIARLRSRGFSGAEVVLALEDLAEAHQKRLLVSLNLSSQESYKKLIFEGFNARDLTTIKRMFEEFDYISHAIRGLEVPDDIIDRPEEYFMDQVQMRRDANRGRPVSFDVSFPKDWALIDSVLNSLGAEMRKQGFFDFNISVEESSFGNAGETALSFNLKKGPRYNIQFFGNVNFWERHLRAKVLDRPIRLGIPFSLPESISLVKNLYLSKGFKDVAIRSEVTETDGEKIVLFLVEEGRRFYLGDLIWSGLSADEVDELRSIENRWKFEMSSPFHHIYFEERAVHAQLPRLLELLQNEGYLQARFLGFDAAPHPEISNRMNIVIPIQLGPIFHVNDVHLGGDFSWADEMVQERIAELQNTVASAEKIRSFAVWLETLARERGFIFARATDSLESIVQYSEYDETVSLKYEVEFGPRVRVGQVVVEGLRRTREEVVLREFVREKMTPGEVWVPSKLERVDQRLLGYGLFGSLRMQPQGGDVLLDEEVGAETQIRDLRVVLNERPGGSVEFGPGYRTDLGLIAFGELSYRNLWGMNRSIFLRAQVSRKIERFQFPEQRYTFSFLEPFLFSYPLAFRFSASYEKKDDTQYDASAQPVGGFNFEEISTAFVLSKELSPVLTLSHNLYTLSRPRIFDLRDESFSDPLSGLQYRIATMGPTLIYDMRDDVFNPSSGWLLSALFEYASPDLGSSDDVHFVLSKTDLNVYRSLRNNLVFAFSGSYAHIRAVGDSEFIPENRRLVLGGRTTLRALPEKSLRFDQSGVDLQNSYLLRSELRAGLFHDIGVAYFLEAGRLDADGFESDGWRASGGFGLRYITPVGPLALDFAVNMNKRSGEDSSRILFSVGVF